MITLGHLLEGCLQIDPLEQPAQAQVDNADFVRSPAGLVVMFLLHDVRGYDHYAIGKMRERSVGNCKSQLHKRASDCVRTCAVAALAPNEATVDGIQHVVSK
jgi:hypothetical protein